MITALPPDPYPDIPVLSGVVWEQWCRADKAPHLVLDGCNAWMAAQVAGMDAIWKASM